MEFIILNEIVAFQKEIITQPIYVKTGSVNTFKVSPYVGAITATQVALQGDCIWVTDTPLEIMDKCQGLYTEPVS